MNNYLQLLKDPRWQKKRLQILQRDKFTCQHCGNTEKQLHVHHFRYSNVPWDDLENEDKYLITLCIDCHEKETETQKHIKWEVQSLCAWFGSETVLSFLKDYLEISNSQENIELNEKG